MKTVYRSFPFKRRKGLITENYVRNYWCICFGGKQRKGQMNPSQLQTIIVREKNGENPSIFFQRVWIVVHMYVEPNNWFEHFKLYILHFSVQTDWIVKPDVISSELRFLSYHPCYLWRMSKLSNLTFFLVFSKTWYGQLSNPQGLVTCLNLRKLPFWDCGSLIEKGKHWERSLTNI